jgi:tetraacyldisaccharide 4'-kinase
MPKINAIWYSQKQPLWWKLLLPFEGAYRSLIFLRRWSYRVAIFKSHRVSVPIIVIGNLSVGGVGKTPLTAAIAEFLKQNHYQPGIISRGYKGQSESWPQIVSENSDPKLVGDEPVLLAKKTKCPVVVAPNRVNAAQELLEKYEVDVIISDDGLQHYALARDIEVVVIDGERECGNGHCLPYGPLRESKRRLKSVDFIVKNGGLNSSDYVMQFQMGELYLLTNPLEKKPITEFSGEVHAVAGIGNPARFFQSLQNHGLKVIEHLFPDHYNFKQEDFKDIPQDEIIIMTEKDAVKCQFSNDPRIWVLPIEAKLPPHFFDSLLGRLSDVISKRKTIIEV